MHFDFSLKTFAKKHLTLDFLESPKERFGYIIDVKWNFLKECCRVNNCIVKAVVKIGFGNIASVFMKETFLHYCPKSLTSETLLLNHN